MAVLSTDNTISHKVHFKYIIDGFFLLKPMATSSSVAQRGTSAHLNFYFVHHRRIFELNFDFKKHCIEIHFSLLLSIFAAP